MAAIESSKRALCIAIILFVSIAFIPASQTWAASKPAKPKVSISVTSSSVTLKWEKVKGASKYQVYRATSKNGKFRKVRTTKGLSYVNRGLKTGKMYFYKVRSISGKKKSGFRKVAATPLAKPTCKSSSLISENKVRTNTITGASGYAVYRSMSKTSGYKYIGSTATLAFDDKTAKTGVTYYYKIRAYKKGSGYTTYSSYSAAGRGTRLLAVPSLKRELVSNPDDSARNAIKLTWSKVEAARGYELYRSSDEGESYDRIYRGNALCYTDKNVNEADPNALKDGQVYYYKVRAYHTVFDGIEAYSYASPSKHSRDKLINQAESWLGYDEKNNKFKKIVDVYRDYKPLARDVTPTYDLAWCTTFVTASAIKSDMVDIMPRERICRYMIDLYKELGGWVEEDSYVPKPGDLILYDWEDNGKGDCTGAPNHIGIVVNVSGSNITDIEGNNNNIKGHPVSYRTVKVNSRYIRGFMTPKFDVDNGIVFQLSNSPVIEQETIEPDDAQIVDSDDIQTEDSDALQQSEDGGMLEE